MCRRDATTGATTVVRDNDKADDQLYMLFQAPKQEANQQQQQQETVDEDSSNTRYRVVIERQFPGWLTAAHGVFAIVQSVLLFMLAVLLNPWTWVLFAVSFGVGAAVVQRRRRWVRVDQGGSDSRPSSVVLSSKAVEAAA